MFPHQIWWLVSAIVIVAIVGAFVGLIRTHWLFLIVLIVLFPFLIPIFKNFFGEIYSFVLYLGQIVSAGAPRG
jgi:hypothetical protein